MLGKLIKHDFRALSRLLVPTSLAIIGATIIATLGIRFNVSSGFASYNNSVFAGIFRVAMTLLSSLLIIGIFAGFFFISFIIFQRFYKNFVTSEGYLTFTLPVTTNSLLWSKLITAFIWLTISFLVGVLCLFIFLLFGTPTDSFANPAIFRGIGEFFRMLGQNYSSGITVIIIELILFAVVTTAYTVLHVYLALIIGGVVSQKHKLLAGIGFYFVINMATGIVTSIVQTVMLSGYMNMGMSSAVIPGTAPEQINYFVSIFQGFYWTMTGLMIVCAAAYFLISHYLLKNKLNLQ